MLPAFRMAQKVHNHLVRETSELQQRIVMLRLTQAEFGEEALPIDRLLLGFNNALSNAPENLERTIKSARERIQENVVTIRELEAMFEEKDNADMEAFARAMAEKFRRESRKEKV